MAKKFSVMPRRVRRGEVVKLPEPVRPVPAVSEVDQRLGVALSRATDDELARLERALARILGDENEEGK